MARLDPDLLDTLDLDPEAVHELMRRARGTVEQDGLPSCQLALARHGQLAASATFGSAVPDNRYAVMSVTKALVAAALWLLIGTGELASDLPVAELVPEFRDGATGSGKAAVTLEHLLTHTAGFPRAPLRPEQGTTSAGRRAQFARWRLDWPPGTRTEYHPVSAHWVAAELVERASGVDYRAFIAGRVLAPLGLERLRLGVPVQDQGDILDIEVLDGGPARPGVPEVAPPAHLLRFNEPAVRAVGVPGAGAVSTAADVALLYQAFLHNPGDLWRDEVLADGTGHVRNRHLDPWTGVPANRTLGLVVAGDDGHAPLREFGRATGPRAFGASGLGGQIAWADPDSGLSFCWLTNGLEGDLVSAFSRSTRLSTAAARCNRF